MDGINIKLILLLILAAAVILLVVILLFQRKRRRKPHRSTYIDALYALIDGRKDDALRLLTMAVKNGEGDVDAYLQLGNLLREKKMPEKAFQIHKSLMVRRDLGFEEEKAIQMALAEDLADLGKIDRSIQALESVYQKRKDPDIVLSLHKLYHRNGAYEKAYAMLKDLSRLGHSIGKSDRAAYLATASDTLIRHRRIEEAKKYLDRARKEDGNSVPALYLTAQLAMQENDLATASKMWERLLQSEINYFGDVAPLLEKTLYESGKFQHLEKVLLELLRRYPRRPGLLNALASFYEKKGELDKAISILENERTSIQEDPVVSARLATLYLETEKPQYARRILEEIDLRARRNMAYTCDVCGNRSDIPLLYCERCFNFNTFTRAHETAAV
ncbi:MAG: tetratricopeptide repeat protein [bacterium]|nr:MAG: tetratricopeptide repeat protein [bacterium]